jgi:guanosine-3',5'-bis(diphosphate) 3'-pyrophosphohydrolase
MNFTGRKVVMKFTADDISLMLKALKFAAHKHRHQRRKNGLASPYINHLIAVSEILWEIGEVRDLNTMVAAMLHDTIEDTDTPPEELERIFGEKICSIVNEVTDDKSLPKQVRKRLQVEHAGNASLEARHVKLADKIANVQDIMDAPPVNWSLKRRWEYIDWAEEVINEMRGSNEKLEQYFDDVCSKARMKFEQEENADEK